MIDSNIAFVSISFVIIVTGIEYIARNGSNRFILYNKSGNKVIGIHTPDKSLYIALKSIFRGHVTISQNANNPIISEYKNWMQYANMIEVRP